MADLDATLRPYVDSGAIPGLVALVAKGDDLEVAVLGRQGPDRAPMRRDSIFRGASITKPLTAALAMLLVEDGLLDLDAPVGLLLPELAEPRVLRTPSSALDDTVPCARPITARHILTSTSGHGFATVESLVVPLLVERLGQASMDVAAVPAPDEWMRRLADIPLIHQPGEGWTYNASYDVLGVLLARAGGQDHVLVLRFRAGILRPFEATGEVLVRVHRRDWAPYWQTDDYSFLPSTVSQPNPRVVVSVHGRRLWWETPAP